MDLEICIQVDAAATMFAAVNAKPDSATLLEEARPQRLLAPAGGPVAVVGQRVAALPGVPPQEEACQKVLQAVPQKARPSSDDQAEVPNPVHGKAAEGQDHIRRAEVAQAEARPTGAESLQEPWGAHQAFQASVASAPWEDPWVADQLVVVAEPRETLSPASAATASAALVSVEALGAQSTLDPPGNAVVARQSERHFHLSPRGAPHA